MSEVHKIEVYPDCDGLHVTLFEDGLELVQCPADDYQFWLARHFGDELYFTNYHG